MEIRNIFDSWGSIINFDNPREFFNQDINFWREFIYKRKLLIFKKMNFNFVDYGKFSHWFGSPWNNLDYDYSKENSFSVNENENEYIITKFVTKLKSNLGHLTIGLSEMPWHSDIPNRKFKPFPFRSIWMAENPNTLNSGKTHWLNIEDSINSLSENYKNLIPNIKIKQQDWYNKENTKFDIYDFIKIHPITGKQSLRLNYYVGYPNIKNSQNAWIKSVYINDIEQKDNSLIQQYIDEILSIPCMFYQHIWDQWDIAIYDNYSFVHGRTQVKLESYEESERILYRINIDHLNDDEWKNKNS